MTAATTAGTAHTWPASLDALEANLGATEALVAAVAGGAGTALPGQPAPWVAPDAPLPASLADRAAALLTRHHTATENLTRALHDNRRQQRAAATIGAATARPTAVSVYVDASA